jgi:preprotein translocase subunit SecG
MFLYYAVTTVHYLVCIILILVVLLQSGKGADLAGAFGGGATQTAFGSRGPASFLSKMTTVAAVLFMVTNLTLMVISTRTPSQSILETTGETAKPAAKAPESTQPATAAPTVEEIQKIQHELETKQKAQAPAAPQVETSKPAAGTDAPKQPAAETKSPSGQKP